MSAIDPKRLQHLQQRWSEIALDRPDQLNHQVSAIISIEEWLKEAGLDQADDASYGFIAEDLTRDGFYKVKIHLALSELLNAYHESQRDTGYQYSGQAIFSRQSHLEFLTNYAIPQFIPLRGEYELPEKISPLKIRQLDVILELHESGLLEHELKIIANEVAKSKFRQALYCKEMLDQGTATMQTLRQGKADATSSLENIEAAKELYTPGMIAAKATKLGWGWTEEQVQFDVNAVKSILHYFQDCLAQLQRQEPLPHL